MKYTQINIYLSSTKYPWWNLNGRFWKTRFSKFLDEYCSNFEYKIKYVDPFKFEESDNPKVVDFDKRAINSCDYFVCYLDKLSIGTIMELMHHYCINNYPSTCVLIDADGNHKYHPWIKYHCKNIFDCVEDAAVFIHNEVIKPKTEFVL